MFFRPLTSSFSWENSLLPLGSPRRSWPGFNLAFPAAYDVYRLEDRVEVWIDLPGLNPEDIDLTVSGRSLEISGRRERPAAEGETITAGRSHGEFKYHLQLSSELDPNRVTAEIADGVLKVKLPLAEEVKPRKIAVGAVTSAAPDASESAGGLEETQDSDF